MMTRKVMEIAVDICKRVKSAPSIEIEAITYSKHRAEVFKNGIYFVYNGNNEIIYIGKVSNAKTASLHMRFKGNGDGSHQKAFWYDDAKQVRFLHFTNELNSEQLKIMERLAISRELPIGNDCDTSEDNVIKWLSFMLDK